MTALDDLAFQIAPGRGIVARLGTAAVVAHPDTPEQEDLAARILDLVAEHAARGRRLARRLAALLAAADPDDTPPFAVVVSEGDTVVIIAHGSLDVTVSAGGDTETVTGRGSATWVDRLVPGPVDRVVIGDGNLVPAPRTDLRSGVVVGAGGVLARRDSPDAPERGAATDEPTLATPVVSPAPSIAGDAPSRADVVIFGLGGDDSPVDEPTADAGARAPLPVAGAPDAALPSGPLVGEMPRPASPRVQGILCSRQHFNDPHALYCAACGISMVQQTHNVVEGERPPLGVLVRDDGATFVLHGDYVVGREPSSDPTVTAGTSTPLVLEDPDRTISRVHARVALRDWDVVITDAGSANGTFHAPPGSAEWTRVTGGGGIVLVPGSRLLIGQRTLVFETNRRV